VGINELMHVMLLASARYNTELDRYVDDGDDDLIMQMISLQRSHHYLKKILWLILKLQ